MPLYVVTGAAGFIGSHLARELVDRGHRVRGVDSFTDYYDRALKEANLGEIGASDAFTFVEADLADTPVAHLFEGADGVFHLAAQAGVRGSWGDTFSLYARDNVVVTQRIFEAAVPLELRVVWASSSSVYGNAETYPTREDTRPRPVSPYGVTKLCCEELAGTYVESRGLITSRSATSPSTGRGNAPTWHSRELSARSPAAGRSRCSARASRAATSPTSATPSPRRSPQWTGA